MLFIHLINIVYIIYIYMVPPPKKSLPFSWAKEVPYIYIYISMFWKFRFFFWKERSLIIKEGSKLQIKGEEFDSRKDPN